jgi:hypothetical protein
MVIAVGQWTFGLFVITVPVPVDVTELRALHRSDRR